MFEERRSVEGSKGNNVKSPPSLPLLQSYSFGISKSASSNKIEPAGRECLIKCSRCLGYRVTKL